MYSITWIDPTTGEPFGVFAASIADANEAASLAAVVHGIKADIAPLTLADIARIVGGNHA